MGISGRRTNSTSWQLQSWMLLNFSIELLEPLDLGSWSDYFEIFQLPQPAEKFCPSYCPGIVGDVVYFNLLVLEPDGSSVKLGRHPVTLALDSIVGHASFSFHILVCESPES